MLFRSQSSRSVSSDSLAGPIVQTILVFLILCSPMGWLDESMIHFWGDFLNDFLAVAGALLVLGAGLLHPRANGEPMGTVLFGSSGCQFTADSLAKYFHIWNYGNITV